MEATNIYDPCDKYTIDPDKFHEKRTKLIRGSVADIKNTALKAMEDILDSYPGQNFRTKVLQNYFYATVPIVTQHPERAAELSTALAEAHEEVYAKRASDERWQGIYAFVGKAAAAAGIVSVVLWLIPPAGAIVTGATSLLGALAVAGSGFLGAGYLLEWKVHEKNEMDALEKAIYSGGQGDVAGLADTMMEFREARRNAIWEGIFMGVGVAPARQLITNPRALRTAYTKANLKDSWKNWRQARKAAKEARQAEKVWANSEKGIEAIQQTRDKLSVAKIKLKDTKGKLRQAKKNLKQNTDNNAVEALQEKVDDLTREKADWSRLRSQYTDQLPKGRIKRVNDWFATRFRSIVPTNAKGTQIRNVVNGQKIKDFFKNAKDRLKNARKSVYALNGEAWKSSDRIKYMEELASTYTKGGGKFYWRLNKDGSAFYKLNDKAYKLLWNEDGTKLLSSLDPKDFKLGADGLWIAVLTADRLDKFFADDRGKRAIEGGLQQLPSL